MSRRRKRTATAPEPPELARLRREYENKARKLEETILALDNLLAPADWLDAGDGFPGYGAWRFHRPAQRTQDRSHAPLSYLNEDEWRQHVALARDLCTRNHLALGFRDHVSNFIGPVQISFVLRGQTPGATSTGPRDANGDGEPDVDPLVRACTQCWEEWCEFAEWGQGEDDREEECRRRLLVEGEATLRFFVGDEESGGVPYVRHIEPELIRTPPGHSTLSRYGWGPITAEDDDEREEGLWVCRPDDVAEGREIGSREYVRIKANVDRTVKRGLSDFFPVGEQLRKVLGLLENIAHVGRLQAAIAWWEQYPTATMEQVAKQVQMGADYQRTKLPPTSAGSSTDVTSYEAGTVVRTEGGREVKPGPVSTGGAWFESVERMVLRSVGFRWGCPSYFSGEGDASFASVLVTGSPFVRITESRQERSKAFACRVATRVLEFCERSGRLPAGASRRVRPVGTCKPVVIADEEKKSRTFLSLYEKNCADPVEFVRSTGADPKVVAANILAWKKKFPDAAPVAPGPTDRPPNNGAPAPTDPAPKPPGSAGGDGSSPNPTATNPLGEGRPLREAAPGPPPRPGLVWNDSTHRWRSPDTGHEHPHPPELVPTGATRLGQPVYKTPLAVAPERPYKYPGVGAIEAAQRSDSHPVVAVDPSEITTLQPYVNGSNLARITGDVREPVILVRYGGKLYLEEGNHRAVTALLRAQRVPAKIIDVSAPAPARESFLSEHMGLTEAGEQWYSAAAYALLSEAGRAGLTLATVTDKNGNQVKRWVRQGTDQGAQRHATTGGVYGPDHVVSRALADPTKLTADDVKALAAHAATLDKEQLRRLNLAFQQKIGGTRAQLAQRLLDHVRARGGDSAPRAEPNPQSGTLAAPAARPRVEFVSGPGISYGSDLPPHSRPEIQAVFGGPVDAGALAAAANGTDGARCSVEAYGGRVEVRSGGGQGYIAVRTFHRDGRGKLVCHNDLFEIEKDGPGPDAKPINPNIPRGADLLANQVRALREIGVSRIETLAAGDRGSAEGGGFVGYKVWPKLGYDGTIPAAKLRRLPPELNDQMGGAKNILKLYETKAGRDWWAENGSSIQLTFDLSDGSPSMKTLEAYLNGRSAKKAN